ncbi:hypothetical protein [Marisediminicola senii]|uniref:hypothetical protein n=1 Tax=Marisediminicola senii TaxID=2711233 RepID=UPI001F39CE71|nr:hypothetical protein [Marisediminicola senii]
MGRILFDTATTIDGFIADDANSLAWLFAVDDEPDDELLPQNATVLVEGSTTYEWVLAESDILANPEKWPVRPAAVRRGHGELSLFAGWQRL